LNDLVALQRDLDRIVSIAPPALLTEETQEEIRLLNKKIAGHLRNASKPKKDPPQAAPQKRKILYLKYFKQAVGLLRQKIQIIRASSFMYFKQAGAALLAMGGIVFLSMYFYDYYLLARSLCLPAATLFTSSFLAAVGDMLRQKIQIIRGSRAGRINIKHVVRWAIVCGIVHGFLFGYIWHDLILVGSELQKIVKMPGDLVFFAPVYHIPAILVTNSWLIEKDNLDEAVKKSILKWSLTYMLGLALWVWAMPLSYFYLSERAPYLAIAIFGLTWRLILSFITANPDKPNPRSDQQELEVHRIFERNLSIHRKFRYFWIAGPLLMFLAWPSWPFAMHCSLAIIWTWFYSRKTSKVEMQMGREKESLLSRTIVEPDINLEIKDRADQLANKLTAQVASAIEPSGTEETPRSSSAGNARQRQLDELHRLEGYRDYLPGASMEVIKRMRAMTTLPISYDRATEMKIEKLRRKLGLDEFNATKGIDAAA